MNLLHLLAIGLIPSAPNAAPTKIGAHYTNTLAGLAVYRSAKESVLFDVGWIGKDGKVQEGYKALVDAKVRFGDAAPNDSFHRISWMVGNTKVIYEWGLAGKDAAIGRISADGVANVRLHIGPAWPGSKPRLQSHQKDVVARAGNLNVSFAATGEEVERRMDASQWWGRFHLDKAKPVLFAIGSGQIPDLQSIDRSLASARTKYRRGRLWAEGDWGDFLSPLQDQLGNSKVYSIETGRLAHIVSRNWCLPDGQVLFCWDSFFNGLMSSLEDPVGAKQTVRAILAAVTPEGFVPNFAGRGWGTSFDRSQPCDGALCVWKIHQRSPDLAFLREAYPKLLRWHRWWFSANGKGHDIKRDGNQNGLLEWGSRTGVLQNAKFESGLDDSPMFDDGSMSGSHMTMDSTDLNALWAMDSDYLARIADAIGMQTDARALRKEKAQMIVRINHLLWNPAMNAYCYRYWSPRQAMVILEPQTCFSADGKPGLKGEYFKGEKLEGQPIERHDTGVDFNWGNGPIEGIGKTNYSVRWTAEFVATKAGPNIFEVTSDDGARLWLDDKLVIDAWTVHPATKYQSSPLIFAAGSTHRFRLEYFQHEFGAEVHLAVRRIETGEPGKVFSERLSPLNFYPLIVGAPTKAQGRKTLDLFFKPTKFGGPYVCSTIARDDPAFPAQGYWRGTVWGPTSYLTFQGVKNYATDAELVDYAEKSVRLFMKNWIADGTCRENFNAMTGWGRSDPHYTWGALLCLLGLEDICDMTSGGRVRLNGNTGKHIKIHNLRLAGKLLELDVEPHRATLSDRGRIVAVAKGRVSIVKLN